MNTIPAIPQSPTLSELPAPPAGKTGWPWTEECVPLPATMPDGAPWPRVTIITPSFNQAPYLEETLRSILLQGYPNLEHIVIDGGSTDESVPIIRRYEPWLAYWISERDRGHIDALNKGLAKSSGAIWTFLNSDDTYLRNAIRIAVTALVSRPAAVAVCGGELFINKDGMVIEEHLVKTVTIYTLLQMSFVPQPAVFLWRSAFERAGGWDASFPLSFDFELWTRLVQLGEIYCIPEVLATTRWHHTTKTASQRTKIYPENVRVVRQVLACPVGTLISASERRTIEAALDLLAVSNYSERFPPNVLAILFHSFHAIIKSPRMVRELAHILRVRLRVILAYHLKGHKRKGLAFSPWGFANTGIHWSQWRSHVSSEQ